MKKTTKLIESFVTAKNFLQENLKEIKDNAEEFFTQNSKKLKQFGITSVAALLLASTVILTGCNNINSQDPNKPSITEETIDPNGNIIGLPTQTPEEIIEKGVTSTDVLKEINQLVYYIANAETFHDINEGSKTEQDLISSDSISLRTFGSGYAFQTKIPFIEENFVELTNESFPNLDKSLNGSKINMSTYKTTILYNQLIKGYYIQYEAVVHFPQELFDNFARTINQQKQITPELSFYNISLDAVDINDLNNDQLLALFQLISETEKFYLSKDPTKIQDFQLDK